MAVAVKIGEKWKRKEGKKYKKINIRKRRKEKYKNIRK